MAERIKGLRQKLTETSYGSEIPLGADLVNVDVSQDLIDKFYAVMGEEKPSSPPVAAEFYIDSMITKIQELNNAVSQHSIVAPATEEGKPEGVDVNLLHVGNLWFIQK